MLRCPGSGNSKDEQYSVSFRVTKVTNHCVSSQAVEPKHISAINIKVLLWECVEVLLHISWNTKSCRLEETQYCGFGDQTRHEEQNENSLFCAPVQKRMGFDKCYIQSILTLHQLLGACNYKEITLLETMNICTTLPAILDTDTLSNLIEEALVVTTRAFSLKNEDEAPAISLKHVFRMNKSSSTWSLDPTALETRRSLVFPNTVSSVTLGFASTHQCTEKIELKFGFSPPIHPRLIAIIKKAWRDRKLIVDTQYSVKHLD